mgnify:FL=1
MKFNTTMLAGLTAEALVTIASSGSASAGSSPFCFAGGPTPKHVCDAIKANQKPKNAIAGSSFKSGSNGAGLNSGRMGR